MKPLRISRSSQPWKLALLLALACAGCTMPIVSEPILQPKAASAPKGTQAAERPKEPVVPRSAQPPGILQSSKSEQELEKGINSYEDGEYKTSARQLKTALDLGLESTRNQVRAHKYLAFITCVSGREKSCREEFRRALDADPNFELAPAEAGHPIWGPALRSVKTERAAKAKPKLTADAKSR